MKSPQLTFFSELLPQPLSALVTDEVLVQLSALKASVSLAILDFTPERAEVVRRFNRTGVPVTAWLLLPEDQGYYFNADNAQAASERYRAFLDWSEREGLQWQRIGLDMEFDRGLIERLQQGEWRATFEWLQRVLKPGRIQRAEAEYARLVEQIQAGGYQVEAYLFPLLVEERQAGSHLLRRLTGMVDVAADREVWMLYSSYSYVPVGPDGAPLGFAVFCSYGPEAPAVGVGLTGRGVEPDSIGTRLLDWQEFARDLRLAWAWDAPIYVFSLEGCVEQGFLSQLQSFEWDRPILLAEGSQRQVDRYRDWLRSLLWIGARPGLLLLGLGLGAWAGRSLRRWLSSSRSA